MRVKATIDTQTIIRVMLVAGGFIIALLLLWALKQALVLIVLSFFLALALNPPVSFLAERMPRDSRALGTGAAYLIVLFIIGLFVYMAVPPLVSDSRELIERLPTYIDELREEEGFIADAINEYDLDTEARELVNSITSRLGNSDGPILNSIGRITSSLISLITVLVLTFLMLIEGPMWLNLFWSVYPDDKEERHRKVAQKMYHVVTGYVNGQLLVALTAGVTSMVFMILIARIDAQTAVPLAGIVGLSGLVPLIGTTLGSAVVIIIALLNSVGAAVAMLIFFIVYQQVENNAIQPFIQSKTIDMSPLLVLTSVIVGFTAGGILGGLVSIPVAGMLRVLIVHYFEHKELKKQGKARKSNLLKRKRANKTA